MSASLDRLNTAIAALSKAVDNIVPGNHAHPQFEGGATEAEVNAAAEAVAAVQKKVEDKLAGAPFPTEPEPFPGESVAERDARLAENEKARVATVAKVATASRARVS